MHDVAAGEGRIPLERLAGWWLWAARHPGVVLFGALAMAFLALRDSPKTVDLDSDSSGEEVPLFI